MRVREREKQRERERERLQDMYWVSEEFKPYLKGENTAENKDDKGRYKFVRNSSSRHCLKETVDSTKGVVGFKDLRERERERGREGDRGR